MALATNQLFNSFDGPKSGKRKHLEEHGVKVATLANDDTLDPTQITLPELCPLVFDTTAYRAWVKTDARVHALLNEAVVLDINDEVQGNIIIRGQISYKDIPNPDSSDTNSTLLKAALAAGMRELGLDIADLSPADQPA